MKYIVINKPDIFLEHTLPKSWIGDVKIISPENWNDLMNAKELDVSADEFYVARDKGYDMVARSDKVSNARGYSKMLNMLANDKYMGRVKLKSMKDIPFAICADNVVNWPHDPADKLFAKPVHGSAALGTVKDVKHGDILPDIGQPYLIEKYIDDKYQRVSVDGYVCGDKIGILTTCDNIYLDIPTVAYRYLGFPSRYHDNAKLREKYEEIVTELREVTGCNNQIIDLEFFAVDGEFVTMEINPRILFNAVPIYHELCGVNQWEFMQSLLNGEVMDLPKSPPKSGVVRYMYQYKDPPEFVRHDEDTFSIHLKTNSQTYATCDASKPYWELIKEIDEKYPVDYSTLSYVADVFAISSALATVHNEGSQLEA